jgi:hypothetical protein
MPTTTPTPVAAWNFNKDLGESAGQYKDSIGGLILQSADNADHPAAAAKVGAGAYAASNSADTVLTLADASSISFTNGGTIALWVRLSSLSAALLDYVLEFVDADVNKVQIRVQLSLTLGRRFGLRINTATPVYQSYVSADTDWHLLLLTVSAPYQPDPEDPGLVQNISLYVDNALAVSSSAGGAGVGSVLRLCGGEAGNYLLGEIDSLPIWDHAISEEQRALVWADGAGWEYEPVAQTIKQHVVVGPTGIVQPVGGCVVVPGWV